MSTLKKMQGVLDLIIELDHLIECHTYHLENNAKVLLDETIHHYKERIVINTAIKERLKKYYNNRLTELKPL